MRAISIKQPWAWAIVNGYKPVENRERNFVGAWRGPLLIHTGREADADSWHVVRRLLAEDGRDPDELPDLEDLAVGGVVGSAELVDVVRHHTSPWFFGPFGLVLRNARPLNLIKCRGQLGLFELDERALGLPSPKAPGQEELFG